MVQPVLARHGAGHNVVGCDIDVDQLGSGADLLDVRQPSGGVGSMWWHWMDWFDLL